MSIRLFAEKATNFSTNGLGILTPTECTVTEISNGMYEAELVHVIENSVQSLDKWRRIKKNTILSIDVPVRTLPEIRSTSGGPVTVTTLETWQVVQENVNVYTSASTTSPVLRTLAEGDKWTATLRNGNWLKGRDGDGRTGWVEALGLEYVKDTIEAGTDGIEKVAPPAFSSAQLFRVYQVSWTSDKVTARARHISYDFAHNLLSECNFSFVKGYIALGLLMDNLYIPPGDFACYTNITSKPDVDEDEGIQSIEWTRVNPITAMLDPDIGFCTLYNAEAVRDNYSIYLLDEAGRDRGFTISYGKNMTGIQWSENMDEVVTRYIPIGQDENGQPVTLPAVFVDSARIDNYPNIHIATLDVSEAQIGSEDEDGNIITSSRAYSMMRAAAKREFKNGADAPEVTISIDFVNLGDTLEHQQFKHLHQVYMHDTVHVSHSRLGRSFSAKVVQTTWDAVKQRYTGIEISTKKKGSNKSTVAGWQIPKGIEGSKIRAGTIAKKQLASGVVAPPIDELPVGTWLPFSGASPPSPKWLFAEGQALDASTYPDAHVIFGANLPDARKRALVHQDTRDPLFAKLHGAIGSETIAPTVATASGGDDIQIFAAEDPNISNVQPSMVVRFIIKVLP